MTVLDITRSLEMGREILRSYLDSGDDTLEQTLRNYGSMIVVQTDRPDLIDTRLQILISGVLSLVYEDSPEQIIRKQTLLSQPIRDVKSIEEKLTVFVDVLSGFIRELSGEEDNGQLSVQVHLYLRTCHVSELRQLTVESLSERFGYNRSYFSRKIKGEMSVSIQELILKEKLRRAYDLLQLKRGKVTVRFLASHLGFLDPAHFSRVFKEAYGVSPSDLSFLNP